MPWLNKNKELDERFKLLDLQLVELKSLIESQKLKPSLDTTDLNNRVADLEIKVTKIWILATTTTTAGKEKLSNHGRRILAGLSTK